MSEVSLVHDVTRVILTTTIVQLVVNLPVALKTTIAKLNKSVKNDPILKWTELIIDSRFFSRLNRWSCSSCFIRPLWNSSRAFRASGVLRESLGSDAAMKTSAAPSGRSHTEWVCRWVPYVMWRYTWRFESNKQVVNPMIYRAMAALHCEGSVTPISPSWLAHQTPLKGNRIHWSKSPWSAHPPNTV